MADRRRSWRATLTFLAMAAIAGCGSHPTLPPDSASPAAVLGAYLTALRAGDCDAARALTMSTFVVGNGELCGALRVSAFSSLTGPATPDDREVVFATTLTTNGDGASIPAGDITWFYALDQQPSGAWRLAGGGSGP